jgi:FtsP/CotA-like multicopper oxidase with cupredoxin domain
VNGMPWPFLKVEPRVYRFRIIDMSVSRVYSLKFIAENAAGDQAWVDFFLIGMDGGFLQRPRKLNVNTIFM